jgi:hypothetical protein
MSGDNFSRGHSVFAETRRRWSEAEKQSIVAEAERPGVNISGRFTPQRVLKPAHFEPVEKRLVSQGNTSRVVLIW